MLFAMLCSAGIALGAETHRVLQMEKQRRVGEWAGPRPAPHTRRGQQPQLGATGNQSLPLLREWLCRLGVPASTEAAQVQGGPSAAGQEAPQPAGSWLHAPSALPSGSLGAW